MAMALLTGCGGRDREIIDCTQPGHQTCLKGGVAGRCTRSTLSDKSYCAYPDAACGGDRWGYFAGDGLAEICVSPLDGGTPDSDVDASSLAVLAMTPTTQDFGSVVTGAQSAEVSFDVSNRGGTAAGTLTTALAGADAAHFTISSDTCAGIPLGAGASCAIKLRFIPAAEGARSATLAVTGTPGGSSTANLAGTGLLQGALRITPADFDFGNLVAGGQSAEQTFTVSNTGTNATGVPSAALSDGVNFTITMNSCSAVLAASATCAVKVRFNPGSVGSKLSSLTVMASPGGAAAASLSGTGVAPAALALTPATQSLGSLVIGAQSTPFAFTVRNSGASPSGAITPTLASSDFSIVSNGCTGPLVANATCSISVQFTAAAPAGAKSAMLVVTASPGGNAMSTVTGTSIAAGALTMSPSTHPFGDVLAGAQSIEQTFTVTNTGGSPTSALTTMLSDSTSFTLTMDGCTAALAAGASCVVKARFNPVSAGAKSATLSVAATSTATGGTAVSQLSGTGQPPAALSITPGTRDFGPVVLGQSAGPLTFTISNTGASATGAISVVVADTTHYMVTSNCTTLAPASNCTASVTYTASGTAGTQNSTITVSASPGGMAVSSLSAQAITAGSLSISPTNPPAFPSVVEGGTGTTQTFTITNTGGSATGIPSVGFATSTSDFTVTDNQCFAALPPAGMCTVTVRFNPSVAGALSANLRVSATPGGTVSAPVSGTGLRKAALSITPATQDFGMIPGGGQSGFFTFTVTNTGEVTSSTVAVALASSPSDFAIDAGTNNCTGPLAATAACTVRVRFTAGTVGAKSNTLQATAGAGVSATSTLTGQSVAVCGDGLLQSGEGCDDGNMATSDGCSMGCQVETPWWCNNAVAPSRCSGAMVPVSAGPFMMGSTMAQESPVHQVALSAYSIDAHEVTNAEYRRCESAGGCTPPVVLDSFSGRDPYYTATMYASHPVVAINWSQATAYCTWAGKRLPTEAEWEKAARGGCEMVAPAACGAEDQRTYPWGDGAPFCSLANFNPGAACVGDTDAAGTRVTGDSPYGAHNMAGNVSEWVADWFDATYYSTCAGGCTDPQGPSSSPLGSRVLRGGDFSKGAGGIRVASRSGDTPTNRQYEAGFRCARSP